MPDFSGRATLRSVVSDRLTRKRFSWLEVTAVFAGVNLLQEFLGHYV